MEETGNKQKIKEVKGDIEFRDVCFRFKNADHPVIRHMDFSVKAGETIAFVGASGAGKTTVLNLVIGFLKANSGQILIDGRDIGTFDLRSYRQHIAVVPQTPILFTGTIRENITYGAPDISGDTLREIIKAANLEDFIESLPEGVETKVTEHGLLEFGSYDELMAKQGEFYKMRALQV